MTDPRQRRPAAPAAMGGERERILARRRLALIVLVVAVPATLIAAILTGSTLFLIINLVMDVVVAGYVALLLQIKQTQERRGSMVARPRQGVPARR
jgi:hypothetical protein